MNKKVLFVFHRMNIGGSGTSLLNLFELFKEQGITLDLFLMSHEGIFVDRAKAMANVLPEDKKLAAVVCNTSYIKKKPLSLLCRVMFVLKKKLFGYSREDVYKKHAKKIKGYDVVVSFQEGVGQQFTRYIDAPKKISWIHNESNWRPLKDDKKTKELFLDYDVVVGVANSVTSSIIRYLDFPEKKTLTIYNTFATQTIKEKSQKEKFQVDENKINFVSVGRFAEVKQFLRAVTVAKMLKDSNVKFHWYIVGAGEQFSAVEQRVADLNLSDCVTLTGAKSNPYPIIKACDCLVITSLHEAHPMVANEAFILNKPVISTLYPSTGEVINDGENGVICENSEEGIFSAMKEYAEDSALRDKLSKNLIDFQYDNNSIIQQIKQLFS